MIYWFLKMFYDRVILIKPILKYNYNAEEFEVAKEV